MESVIALPNKIFYKFQNPLLEKQSILLIDDCRSMLELHQAMLEFENFEVFTAGSGKEALAVLLRINRPNLILLDMQMEGMTGIEFLIELEIKLPEIINSVPVVFLTSLKSVPKSRAIGCIQKPTGKKKFIESVHHYIKMGTLSHFKSYVCDS